LPLLLLVVVVGNKPTSGGLAALHPPRLPRSALQPAGRAAQPTPGRQAAFRFAELFAGIGGFRLGLEACGGECVLAAEVGTWAREIYALNFGGPEARELAGDVRRLEPADLEPCDLLTAGFPCQPFTEQGGPPIFPRRVRPSARRVPRPPGDGVLARAAVAAGPAPGPAPHGPAAGERAGPATDRRVLGAPRQPGRCRGCSLSCFLLPDMIAS
ncbi:unnamed protein product, partial [Prorocentrum cordatum]